VATRMQQRRGTALQWTSTNNGDGPILNAGEIGFESDTGKFKIGDGVNHWIDLDYFLDESDIDSITGDYVLSSTLGQANGVATLDGSGKLTASQVPNIDELAQDAVDGALVAGTGLNKTYNDNANTITLDIDSTVTTNSGSQTLTNKTIDTANNNITVVTADISDITATASELNILDGVTATTAEINHIVGVTSAIQTQIDTKASSTDLSNHSSDTTSVHGIADTSKIVLTDSASTTLDGNLVVDGDFTVNGTNFAASATSITIEDNMVQLAHQNPANTVDLGIVVAYNDGTAKHAGIVRDVSSDSWKLFKGVTTEPATTVDFTQGSLDDLQVAGLTASSITVGDVSNTEFGYLNGVTSAIQTQLDSKAPTSSPTFTGTVSGITATMVGLGNVDNTSDANKPISTATQTALDLKAPLANPTFTGTVTLPNSTVTNSMLAGSIANNKLANSSVTINGETVSLGGTVTISAAPTPQAVSSNITMQANYNYFVDTTAARTLTLPASPALGDTIAIYEASGTAATNNITVARNGNKINALTEDAIVDVNQAVSLLVYTGATLGWKFD